MSSLPRVKNSVRLVLPLIAVKDYYHFYAINISQENAFRQLDIEFLKLEILIHRLTHCLTTVTRLEAKGSMLRSPYIPATF